VFPSFALLAADGKDRARRIAQKTFDLLIGAGLAIMVVMLTVPDELLNLVAGHDFAAGADAVRLLAPYPLIAFVASLMWWLLVAAHEERALVLTSVGLLALNVGLNFALIPAFGFRAAAAISTASELLSLAAVTTLSRRRIGFRPKLRYSALLVAAASAAAVLAFALPGPRLVAAAVAMAVYGAFLLTAPGTIRTAARDILAGTRQAMLR
jgi:O-antigen/teichoic acid export membrane protein